MFNHLGTVGSLKIVECSGWDAMRGIIGREEMLQTHCFLFRNCPMIHSFLVKKPFYAIFIESAGRTVYKELVKPFRFSGIYQFSALCLESKMDLTDSEIQKIVALADKA